MKHITAYLKSYIRSDGVPSSAEIFSIGADTELTSSVMPTLMWALSRKTDYYIRVHPKNVWVGSQGDASILTVDSNIKWRITDDNNNYIEVSS
jgi:hypothetical protein